MTDEGISGSEVWVADLCGYDARGGSASVYSSEDRAKAAFPSVRRWTQTADGWEEATPAGSVSDIVIIYRCTVDG